MRRQCDILSFNRSSLYYERIGLSEEDQRILDETDKIYLDFPFYGSRRMSRELKRRGYKVGRHKARSMMRILGVEAIYPRKRLSFPDKEHQIYPYLLRDVTIDRPDIAWATDITYIRLKHGFVYLVAVMDIYSRYIVSWRISNTLETDFCCEAFKRLWKEETRSISTRTRVHSLQAGISHRFSRKKKIKISMDGKGRVIDNIFIERFWRTLKYEEVYTKSYETVAECRASIGEFIQKYNQDRLHQSLGEYDMPLEAYRQMQMAVA